MPARTGFLHAGGRRLEYAWHGPPPGGAPTLVFLHEGLGCVSLWRDFPARLAEATGCGALVYSRAGYGRSDPVPLPLPVRFMHDEGLAAGPVETAVLPGVGHSPHRDAPDATLEAMARFVAAIRDA